MPSVVVLCRLLVLAIVRWQGRWKVTWILRLIGIYWPSTSKSPKSSTLMLPLRHWHNTKRYNFPESRQNIMLHVVIITYLWTNTSVWWNPLNVWVQCMCYLLCHAMVLELWPVLNGLSILKSLVENTSVSETHFYGDHSCDQHYFWHCYGCSLWCRVSNNIANILTSQCIMMLIWAYFIMYWYNYSKFYKIVHKTLTSISNQ